MKKIMTFVVFLMVFMGAGVHVLAQEKEKKLIDVLLQVHPRILIVDCGKIEFSNRAGIICGWDGIILQNGDFMNIVIPPIPSEATYKDWMKYKKCPGCFIKLRYFYSYKGLYAYLATNKIIENVENPFPKIEVEKMEEIEKMEDSELKALKEFSREAIGIAEEMMPRYPID